ncbi:MAG: protein kinase [Deltaproteobacteria bacterium]
MIHPGQNVGGYQLIRPLGEGPFGMVWLSQDARGTPVVLKMLRPTFASRPSGQAAFGRLQATVHLHKNLIHDSLARVYGTTVDPMTGTYAMLSQYVEGRLLNHVQLPPAALKGQEPRSLAVLLSWFESLADVMAWLHTQGVIHGNLKPSNVMLMRAGQGHITSVLDLSWSSIGLAAPAAGMPSYLAPEQLRGASPTEASDQWSIGKMLSEILSPTGEALTLGALPAVLVLTVQRAMHADPAQRFDTMIELTSSLRAIRLELERAHDGPAPQREQLGVARPPSFADEPETELQSNPLAADRQDTPILRSAPPREASIPPVPSARKMIPSADTGDFPNPPDRGEPSFGGGLDALPPDETFTPGSLDSPSVADEPALSFDSLNVPDEGLAGDGLSAEGGFGDAAFDHGPSLTAPADETATPPPKPPPPKRTKYLAVYGFLLMFLAGAIAVGAIKFVGDGVLAKNDPPPPPTQEDVPDAPPPPVEDPPPVDIAPPVDEAPPPKSPPPPPPPPPEKKAPPPPAKVVKDEPPPPPPPPKKAPPPDVSDDLDLDRAFAKIDKTPPPPASSGFDPRDASVGCDEGDGESCLQLARYLLDDKGAALEAAKTFERACSFGRAVGCQEAGLLYAKSGQAGDKKEAIRLHTKACDKKLSAGCHAAALLLRADDAEAARAMDAKACALGRKSSCAAAETPPPPPPPSPKEDDGSSLDDKLDDDDETSTSTKT